MQCSGQREANQLLAFAMCFDGGVFAGCSMGQWEASDCPACNPTEPSLDPSHASQGSGSSPPSCCPASLTPSWSCLNFLLYSHTLFIAVLTHHEMFLNELICIRVRTSHLSC